MVQLAGSESSAVWQIMSYLQKGYIERVRRNLYAVISMETGQAVSYTHLKEQAEKAPKEKTAAKQEPSL